jgi:hypothetical protein
MLRTSIHRCAQEANEYCLHPHDIASITYWYGNKSLIYLLFARICQRVQTTGQSGWEGGNQVEGILSRAN